ncbi:hypothetical protein MBLNU230_g4144t1 [Neophaeotheca triangularis]
MRNPIGYKRSGGVLAGREQKRIRLGGNSHAMVSRGKVKAATRDAVFKTVELLELILVNVDTADLVKCILVNKQWRDLAINKSPSLRRKLFLQAGNGDLTAGPNECWTYEPDRQSLRVEKPTDAAKISPEHLSRTVTLCPSILNPLIFKHLPARDHLLTPSNPDLSGLAYVFDTRFLARPDMGRFRQIFPRHRLHLGKGSMVYSMYLTQPAVRHAIAYLAYYPSRPAKNAPRPEKKEVRVEVVNHDGVTLGDLLLRFLAKIGGIEDEGRAESVALRVALSRVWCMGAVFVDGETKGRVRKGVFDRSGLDG